MGSSHRNTFHSQTPIQYNHFQFHPRYVARCRPIRCWQQLHITILSSAAAGNKSRTVASRRGFAFDPVGGLWYSSQLASQVCRCHYCINVVRGRTRRAAVVEIGEMANNKRWK